MELQQFESPEGARSAAQHCIDELGRLAHQLWERANAGELVARAEAFLWWRRVSMSMVGFSFLFSFFFFLHFFKDNFQCQSPLGRSFSFVLYV